MDKQSNLWSAMALIVVIVVLFGALYASQKTNYENPVPENSRVFVHLPEDEGSHDEPSESWSVIMNITTQDGRSFIIYVAWGESDKDGASIEFSVTDLSNSTGVIFFNHAYLIKDYTFSSGWLNLNARSQENDEFNLGFPQIDNKMGLWVHTTSSGDTTENEPSVTSTDIPLVVGWNLIGYPSNTVDTVSNVMSGFTGTYDIIQRYDTSSGSIVTMQATDNMEYGNAYWVHVTTAGTLTVNW